MYKIKQEHLAFSDSLRSVYISNVISEKFNIFSKTITKIEYGGILLGYTYSYYDFIFKITLPSQYDLPSINSFIRSRINAQLQINEFWHKSNGKIIYLGEWHTHNEVNPSPSLIDRKMIKKVFKETVMEIEFLYFVIVGANNNIWVGRHTREGLMTLKQLNN